MIKEKFIHFIRSGLTGGRTVTSQLGKYHVNDIGIAVETAVNEIFYDLFKNDPTQQDRYATNYDETVTYDTNFQYFYIDIPASYVQVKGDEGIRWVIDAARPYERYKRVEFTEREVFFTLGNQEIDTESSYSINGNTLVLDNLEEGTTAITVVVEDSYYRVKSDTITYNSVKYYPGAIIKGVAGQASFTGDGHIYLITPPTTIKLGLIIPFTALGDSDDFVFPTGQDQLILERVQFYFQKLGAQDLTNDSISP